MGLFATLKRVGKMSEASAVIQGVLEPLVAQGMDGDPKQIATRLTALCWAQRPEVFDGKFGRPPHKLATAAIALASGFEEYGGYPGILVTLHIGLGEILKEVDERGSLYPFHDLDMQLFQKATDAFFREDKIRRINFPDL